MKKILSPKLMRIIKNKAKLEKILNIKITNRGKEVNIQGDPEDEYVAEKVIDALNFGFKFTEAISITEEDKIFEIINIKDHTTKKDLNTIRSRIIGKEGKCLSTLETLGNCFIEVNENKIGIIGNSIKIDKISQAIVSIIKGAKHGNAYCYLERNQPKHIYDLGLRGEK